MKTTTSALAFSRLVILLLAISGLMQTYAVSTWRPLTDTPIFKGTWMASASEGWAVGEFGLISHTTDSGATWTEQTSGVTVSLNGVWGTDASNVWAVGDAGTILKWNGTAWAAQASGVTINLNAVDGTNGSNIWAVGNTATIIKFNGTDWTTAVQDVPASVKNNLLGVWAANATTLWAVGAGGRILKSSNGNDWTASTSGTTNDLYSVWGTSTTNIIAVGEAATVRISTNGTAWNAGPTTTLTGILHGVSGTAANSIWIVGDAGGIAFYNGTGNFVNQTSSTAADLFGVSAFSATSVTAVGSSRNRLHYNGTAWTALTGGFPPTDYNATWATDDDSVWFVGNSGRAMRWNGTTFASGPATGTNARLNDVWGVNNEKIWAVGAGGVIRHWDGTAWGAQTATPTVSLNGVHGTGPTDVWAVGDAGTIIHYDGTTWTVKTSSTTSDLNAVWASSSTAAWAVGAGGIILKWNGTAWAAQTSGINRALNDISGASATAIWAVGANGTILKYNGSAWAPDTSGTNVALNSVTVINATDAWAIGATTIVRRSTGTSWIADGTTGWARVLMGCFATSADTVFLAARDGAAFTNSPLSVPQIEVTQGSATELINNKSSVNFGNVFLTTSQVRTFTIRSTGNANLTGLSITKDGTHATNYTISALTTTTLPTGTDTTFDVTFLPSAAGARTATLHIASNDLDEDPLNIPLTGTGVLPVVITKHPESKTVNPGTKVVFSVTATGTAPLHYQWQKWDTGMGAYADIVGAPSLSTYTILSADNSHEGDYRVIVDNLPISTATSNAATLSVNEPIVITASPVSKTVAVNEDVTFDVTATGTTPKYQWRRNNVNLPAPASTLASYTFDNPQLTNAGTISVVVSNAVNSITAPKLPVPAATLTVVDTGLKTLALPTTSTAKITAPFAGPAVSFAWKRNGGPLPVDPRFTFVKNVLTITKLQTVPMNDSDIYTCDITGPDGITRTAQTQLIVYSDKPVITGAATITMADAMVGDPSYHFPIPIDGSSIYTPTKFAASPLPTGLVCNPVTGVISGRPAVAITADKLYNVTLTVSNVKGPTTKPATLLLKPMPLGSTGIFTGPVTRQSVLNLNLGGKVDVTATTSGAFTGKLTMGVVVYSFKGIWITDLDAVDPPTASAIIPRKLPLLPLTLTFKGDPNNLCLVDGSVTDGPNQATFTKAWKKLWGTPLLPAELADLNSYMGYYTFGMEPPAPVVVPPITEAEALPQGMGYGAFTVAKTGALTVAGRLPDSMSYTAATFCGPDGEVLVYKALYSNKGSVLGALDIVQGTPGFTPAYGDSRIAPGTVSWLRPAITGYVYKNGFGPVDLGVVGARYLDPAPALLFGVTDDGSNNNARIVFADGGLTGTSTDSLGTFTLPNMALRIKAGAAVAMKTHSTTIIPDPNPCSTSLAIKGATGLFSGKFTLIDGNPAVPGTNISRPTLYYGIIFSEAPGVLKGYGHFLLARRPDALSTQKVTTTDRLSGQVVLEKFP